MEGGAHLSDAARTDASLLERERELGELNAPLALALVGSGRWSHSRVMRGSASLRRSKPGLYAQRARWCCSAAARADSSISMRIWAF
jgi:hypothetical protein